MKKVCISKNWFFSYGEQDEKIKLDLPHDYCVTLPRDADAPGGASNGFFAGTFAKYSKFIKPTGAANTILNLDGAYMCARIYCNNQLLDMHPYGYTPYLVDLSKTMYKDIDSKIEINVTNVQPSTRWYSGASIYRDVFLWTGEVVRIEPWDLFVTTKSISDRLATMDIKLDVTADMPCNADIAVRVLDDDKNVVAEDEFNCKTQQNKTSVGLTMDVPEPNLWSCDTPYIYKLQVYSKRKWQD